MSGRGDRRQFAVGPDGAVSEEFFLPYRDVLFECVDGVAAGFECGMTLEGFNDIKEGDVIEAFEVRELPRD